MAVYVEEVSRTFGEYLLIPGLTTKQCVPSNVSLRTPLVKHAAGTQAAIELNIPFVSAIMQSVSGPELAIELARNGGLSFIFGSQPIASQAEMVRKVKKFKAGFVTSDSNLTPEHTLEDVLRLLRQTGHSTIGITDDGSPNGHLLGLVTSRDYRISRDPLDKKIKDFMTPFEKLIVGEVGLTLSEANQIIWDHKLNTLPIIDKEGRLAYFVFRKDYDSHKENPNEVSSPDKKLLVGAGINTRDYQERVPALVEAGVDVLCIDSSDGYSEWQYETLQWIKQQYGDKVLVGAGNVVDKEGFLYLAEAGADFVKVGIGGGSICITREQKGIGRGQATALQDVARARDEYQARTGIYVPICSDGGLVHDYHMVLALAMRVLPIFIQKQQLDTFATELVREAEVSGRVGTETSRRAAVLSEKTGLYPDILWSSHGRIQLNEEVTVTLTMDTNIGLFGEFASFPVTLRAQAAGKSEVYWK